MKLDPISSGSRVVKSLQASAAVGSRRAMLPAKGEEPNAADRLLDDAERLSELVNHCFGQAFI